MKIEHSTRIEAPLERVYSVVKYELPEVAQYLPNITKIEVVSSELEDNGAQIVNRWVARVKVPALVKRVVTEDLFAWKDTAVWDDDKHEVTYVLESFVSSEIFSARGHNYFVPQGEATKLRITCEIDIYPEKIPGIPSILGGKLRQPLEELIKSMLAPNLTSLGKGINAFLKQEKL